MHFGHGGGGVGEGAVLRGEVHRYLGRFIRQGPFEVFRHLGGVDHSSLGLSCDLVGLGRWRVDVLAIVRYRNIEGEPQLQPVLLGHELFLPGLYGSLERQAAVLAPASTLRRRFRQ